CLANGYDYDIEAVASAGGGPDRRAGGGIGACGTGLAPTGRSCVGTRQILNPVPSLTQGGLQLRPVDQNGHVSTETLGVTQPLSVTIDERNESGAERLGERHVKSPHDPATDDEQRLASVQLTGPEALDAAGQRLDERGLDVIEGVRDVQQMTCCHRTLRHQQVLGHAAVDVDAEGAVRQAV